MAGCLGKVAAAAGDDGKFVASGRLKRLIPCGSIELFAGVVVALLGEQRHTELEMRFARTRPGVVQRESFNRQRKCVSASAYLPRLL